MPKNCIQNYTTATQQMTILDNSIFHLTTILLFLFGLGALILSYMKRKYEYSAAGFMAALAGFFLILFIAVLNKDIFVLSSKIDYGANYAFSFSVVAMGIVSSIGLIIYYLHRIIPIMFIQLGIILCSALILVTFGSSISQSITNHKAHKSEDPSKFMKAEDFQKGSSNPKLSKAGKDTLNSQ
jgi:hypothetical protein